MIRTLSILLEPHRGGRLALPKLVLEGGKLRPSTDIILPFSDAGELGARRVLVFDHLQPLATLVRLEALPVLQVVVVVDWRRINLEDLRVLRGRRDSDLREEELPVVLRHLHELISRQKRDWLN